MVDGEFSQTLQTQAREHREMFLAILQMTKIADDEYAEKKQVRPRQQQ